MTADVSQTEAKRNVAIEAVERLFRVCSGHESDTWMRAFVEVHKALRDKRDEDAITIAREHESRFSTVQLDTPKWVVSEHLAEDVRRTLAGLRTHIVYGDRRPPLTLRLEDPEAEAMGTRRQANLLVQAIDVVDEVRRLGELPTSEQVERLKTLISGRVSD